jgi:hypothetical protein
MFDDPTSQAPVRDRRSGEDRRASLGRRTADSRERMREMTATLLAFCGGLVVLFLFFVATGTVDPGDALAATLGAIGLTVLWLVGVYQRYRSGAMFVTRRDRERRGF